ncbi:MAG: HAD family hydrolase [Clostridia bacterium]|nr:HAD family hydrolase [Clostridia bacterium]
MKFKNVLFDLDGTLTDPFEGITNSIVYALRKFGIEVEDKRALLPFIGPPLFNSFREIYGFSAADAEKAVKLYREYFAEKGIFENRVYEGVLTLLHNLEAEGKTLILATSKPEPFAEKIVKHFEIDRYLRHIAGATFNSERCEKPDVIRYALEKAQITELDETVMVGDRKYDILGAKANGIKSVGVLYGYGTKEELIGAGADYLALTPQDIIELT